MKAVPLLVGFILASIHFAEAQQPKKVPRIGYLLSGDSSSESERFESLRLALRELGYIEGQNITIEYRYAEGKRDLATEHAAELVRLKVDIVLIAGGAPLIQAAKNATTSIPIIMTGAGLDPVKAGFIKTLARPGGNVTGVTNLTRELGGKRLELLKEAVPKVARVAVLYDPTLPGAVREMKEVLPVAARPLEMTVRSWDVRDADGLEKIFAVLIKERPNGLYVSGGPVTNANEKKIADFALKTRLPAVYGSRSGVESGGLMSYHADRMESYRRAATYVDKILKGAKPADLPVQQPTNFELVINLKMAKQIGVTIPSSVLARADKVIR